MQTLISGDRTIFDIFSIQLRSRKQQSGCHPVSQNCVLGVAAGSDKENTPLDLWFATASFSLPAGGAGRCGPAARGVAEGGPLCGVQNVLGSDTGFLSFPFSSPSFSWDIDRNI